MKKSWDTKDQDMQAASVIIREYASDNNVEQVGMIELVVDIEDKEMRFRMAKWILELADHFYDEYGMEKGEFITRQVISQYLTQGKTLH